MRMKKIANIFLLLLTILFVAHVVLPHHHHTTTICIENTQCENNTQPHDHTQDAEEPPHEDKNGFQTCILKQIVPNQNNLIQRIFNRANGNSDFPLILFVVLFTDSKYYSEKTTGFAYIPVSQSDYTVFVSWCFGLRAPPIV